MANTILIRIAFTMKEHTTNKNKNKIDLFIIGFLSIYLIPIRKHFNIDLFYNYTEKV